MGKCKKVMMGIVWFFLLILFAWWIGLVCGIIHCILSPCGACCECAKSALEFLLKGVRLPYRVSTFLVEGKSCGKAIISCVV